MITEKYRKDYTGEFVVTGAVWTGGKKRIQREWIPNPIENHHISGRAACIASNVDREYFDYRMLEKHRGGLLGIKKLQTYGAGEIALEMRLDFTVEKDEDVLTQLTDNEYFKTNTIYTSPKFCLKYPGIYYTIPYNPTMLDVCLLPYLAAFDGHQEVFLLGYNNDINTFGQSNWSYQIKQVVDAYRATKFYHVGHPAVMPESWNDCANMTNISFREFITYADV